MPWTRSGDTAATYPRLMAVVGLAGADDRILNEMAGWIWRCSCQSSAHLTDYRVDMGTATMLAGFTRMQELMRFALKAGLMEKRRDAGVDYLVLHQDQQFIHILLKEEVDRRRQHDRDAKNHGIRVPMVIRDGDQCRYCGVEVVWYGPTSGRRGTMDHRDPNKEAPTSADDVVVACLSCNSARRDGREEWERTHPLQPAPRAPFYGVATARYLTEHGHPTEPNLSDPKRGQRGGSAGAAPRKGTRPAAEPAAASSSDTARGAGESAQSLEKVSPLVRDFQDRKSGLSGSGRDGPGTGQDGTGYGRGQEGSGYGRGQDGPGTGQDGHRHSSSRIEQKTRRRGSRGSGKGK